MARGRRQTWRMTRRELARSMTRDGRKWVNETWTATARTAADLDSLSPLTTLLGNRLVESYARREHPEDEDVLRALRVAVVCGYASRIVLADPTDQPSLKPSAFQLNAQSDGERLSHDDAAPKRLLDPVRSIASEKFDSVMTLPSEVWSGYVATATLKLQQQFRADNKKLAWQMLSRERVEKMLRYGYVLRCMDESIRAEPKYREPQPDPA